MHHVPHDPAQHRHKHVAANVPDFACNPKVPAPNSRSSRQRRATATSTATATSRLQLLVSHPLLQHPPPSASPLSLLPQQESPSSLDARCNGQHTSTTSVSLPDHVPIHKPSLRQPAHQTVRLKTPRIRPTPGAFTITGPAMQHPSSCLPINHLHSRT